MTPTKHIRWPASRKRELVASIFSGERTKANVLEEHDNLSDEELESWMSAYQRGRGDTRALSQKAMNDARKTPPSAA